ncbi:hypothetical protein EMIHUDRAFT_117407 [Emiliania huxleyi CCMP1516]|uniref:AP2/ERF domain-containing protein n=2 Tax=Emiliania huxleyi TaxID=2903 RepID=A0A0D3JBJ4_EMIH1|nr:hypothetical protein EMIHUDRAFT_117407 [Emiliania huxleyi CCMP1516]EOD20879.1 hypothetical protein EMIHUDRAFT_117407 [Emiliania huxleyi CCMP1516]|eukprot:XP_005773308.1 hypothetical protein EMIHUDRAFT_117407 [Emiliania huxleyi CCMP1516]
MPLACPGDAVFCRSRCSPTPTRGGKRSPTGLVHLAKCKRRVLNAQAKEAAPEAEGLRLHLSHTSSTGYRGVWRLASGRFVAHRDRAHRRTMRPADGKKASIGYFDTAVEAAVAYARAVGEAAAAAGKASDSDEREPGGEAAAAESSDAGEPAERQAAEVVAEAEGLRLHLSSNNSTGYKRVSKQASGRFKAQRQGYVTIGTFDTAVEAAVAYAKAAGEYQPPAQPPPIVATEAEGLRLHLSSRCSTGYLGVFEHRSSGRFEARRSVDGRQVTIGYFGSAVAAAVAYARAVGEAAAATAGEAGPSAAAAGEASDSGEGEPGGAGGEAAAGESSSEEEEEAASTPLRAPSCKTLGCNLRLWHEGPCSTAVTGKRARILTDKAREAKRGKGGGGRRGGGGGGSSSVLLSPSSDGAPSPPDAEALSDSDEVEEVAPPRLLPEHLPHQRALCPLHPFHAAERPVAAPVDGNEAVCPNCYCFACDAPVSACRHWRGGEPRVPAHCNAHADSAEWRTQRSNAKRQRTRAARAATDPLGLG